MLIIRIVISLLCILNLYLMGLYAKAHYDSNKDDFLFRLSIPDGLKGQEEKFVYKRVIKIKDDYFAFGFKGKLVWVKSPYPDLIRPGNIVSMYGEFGKENIFYPKNLKFERFRAIKKVVSSIGCLIAFLFFFRAFRFNLRSFIWEPKGA